MKSYIQTIIAIALPMLFYIALIFAILIIIIDAWNREFNKASMALVGYAAGIMLVCTFIIFLARLPVKKTLLAGLENIFWFV